MRGLLARGSLAGKAMLDVGCGAGHNFQVLIEPHCDEESLYVAADVSFAGLRLNRMRNPHKNAIYIMCSADRLPFQPGAFDLLCYFGILHHTERKAATLAQDSALLREGGSVLLHEALERANRPAFLKGADEAETSAHEETIRTSQLLSVLGEIDAYRVAEERWSYSAFFGVARHFLVRHARSRSAYELVSAIDRAMIHGLGWLLPHFKPAEVLMRIERGSDQGLAGPASSANSRLAAFTRAR